MIAGLILTGGKNRRMNGYKKLYLRCENERFLERILQAFSGLSGIFLSVEDQDPYRETGLFLIKDLIPDAGPMGGIYSALEFAQEHNVEAFFVSACDLPNLTKQAVEKILQTYRKQGGIVLAAHESGIEPLFGIYPVSVLEALRVQMKEKNYRMRSFLELVGYHTVFFEEEKVFANINTIDAYQRLVRTRRPLLFAVSGYKNSGKTTLITQIIPELTKLGYKVAVIKHDGHDFVPDVPGTDSDRHRRAGAYAAAVYSSFRYMVTKETSQANELMLAELFPEADIILIEGLKNSSYPKVICEYPEKALPDVQLVIDLILSELDKMAECVEE